MGGVISDGIFFIILIIFIASFQKNKAYEIEPLGYETSRQIKGIGIMAVLFGHMTIMFKLINIPLTPFLGAQGVEVFLFLSAFGLTASYTRKGLQGFFKKRLLVIFIPYIIFNIVRIPIMMVAGIKLTALDIVKSLIALDVKFDASMWYIQYIIIWYLIFFIIFAIKPLKINQKVSLLTGVGLILLAVTLYMFKNDIIVQSPIMECYSHHLAFPLGAVFFLFYEKLREINKWKYLIISAISFIIYFFSGAKIPRLLPYYVANISFIFFIVFLFMFIAKQGYKSKVLCLLGDLAYYIYLNELFVMAIFVLVLKTSSTISVIGILITTVILGVLTKLPSDLLVKKLR